jgi:hypothetical protein
MGQVSHDLTKSAHAVKPWAFGSALRLSALALLLVMLSLLVDGLTSSALVVFAAILALIGVIEFVQAWRWRLSHAEDERQGPRVAR